MNGTPVMKRLLQRRGRARHGLRLTRQPMIRWHIIRCFRWRDVSPQCCPFKMETPTGLDPQPTLVVPVPGSNAKKNAFGKYNTAIIYKIDSYVKSFGARVRTVSA